MLVAHGVAPYLQGEDLAVADDVVERDTLCRFNGFHWLACGDAAEQREAVRALLGGAGRQDVDRAAAVVGALEEALILQVGDVLVYCGEGAESETAGDLFVGRRVTVLLGEAGEEVQDLFLPPRDSHAGIVANKKRIG